MCIRDRGVGVAQGDGLEVALLHPQHGDVVLLLAAHQGGVIAVAVGEKHLDVLHVVDHVVVGDDVAGGGVGADDEAGAGHGVAHLSLIHI